MIRPDETPARWWDETTQAIVGGILAAGAFDRLPVLADAMEEGGCDGEILAVFRRPELTAQDRELFAACLDRLAAGVLTWGGACAAHAHFETLSGEFTPRRYERYDDNGPTAAELEGKSGFRWVIDTLAGVVRSDERYHCDGYDNPDSTEEMWDHYANLTGTPKGELRESYDWDGKSTTYPKSAFSCSC